MSKKILDKNRTLAKVASALLIVVIIICGAMVYRSNLPSPGQVHLDAGLKLIADNQAIPAVKELEDAVKLDPKLLQGWQLLGDIYLEGHRYASALAALDHVKSLSPTTPLVNEKIAKAEYTVGNTRDALAAADEELKTNPNSVIAHSVAADCLQSLGEGKPLLVHLRKLIEMNPTDVKAQARLARMLVKMKEYEEANPVIDKIIQLDPNYPESYGLRGEIIYDQEHSASGLIKAEEYFMQAHQRSPKAVPPMLFLGRVYTAQHRAPEAIKILLSAVILLPKRADLYFALAAAYDQAGKSSEAASARVTFEELRFALDTAQAKEKQLTSDPDNVDKLLEISLLYIKLDMLEKAENLLLQAHSIKKDDPRLEEAMKSLHKRAYEITATRKKTG